MQRIDFQSSDLRWVTKEIKSQGCFRLEAVMRLYRNAWSSHMLFVLGAPVLAGNLYVNSGLCKRPPYFFQVAGSQSNHVIFRTPIIKGARAESDSHGLNTLLFESFDINLDLEPAKLLSSYDEIAWHFLQRDQFSCMISIDIANGSKIELEFPIKHLNILNSQKLWQFETGSVLFLKQDKFEILNEVEATDLLPCFVHCNRFDAAEFSIDFPFSQEISVRTSSAKSKNIGCRVQLLVTDRKFNKLKERVL